MPTPCLALLNIRTAFFQDSQPELAQAMGGFIRVNAGYTFSPLFARLGLRPKKSLAMCWGRKPDIRNSQFTRPSGANDIDARTLWHCQAIVLSPNLLSTTPGVGTAYLTCFRNKGGAFLDGGKSYR